MFKVGDPSLFKETAEDGMDFHFATTRSDGDKYFIVVGGRVAISVQENVGEIVENYVDQPWLEPGILHKDRVRLFEEWITGLPEAPPLSAERTRFGQSVILRFPELNRARQERDVLAFIVGPFSPLPPPPPRPASIYGHLPFGAMTDASTILYRWEAFPSSMRIIRSPTGGTIVKGTYAAPASETAFAPTGFAAVARFALPNLLPACFRWELQPDPIMIECGASVPLYGQSGGGVEVRFPKAIRNRCSLADPVILPAL